MPLDFSQLQQRNKQRKGRKLKTETIEPEKK